MILKKGVLITFLLLSILVSSTYAVTSVCSCTPVNYKFSLKNNKDIAETYIFSLDSFEDYISLNYDKVVLGAGESKTISVEVDFPCDTLGEQSFNVLAKPTISKEVVKVPFSLDIVPCYGYSVQKGRAFSEVDTGKKLVFKPYESNYSICSGDRTTIPLLVTNNGIDNEYYFDTDGPNWAKLSGRSLSLLENQKGILYLTLDPGYDIDESYELVINSSNKIGDTRISTSINLDVDECYGIDIALDQKSDVFCGCEANAYELSINNTGTKKGSFEFVTDPFWASVILDEGMALNSSQEEYVFLSLQPPCKRLPETEVKVTGFLIDRPEVQDSVSLRLKFVSEDACYDARIIADRHITLTYQTSEIDFSLANEGEKDLVYSLSLDGPNWVRLDTDTVNLKSGEGADIRLEADIGEDISEGDYDITINLQSGDYKYSKNIVLRLREKTASQIINEFFGAYGFIFLIIFFVVILSFIFIAFRKKKPGRRAKRKPKWKHYLYFGLVLLLLLVGYAIFTFFPGIIGYLWWYRYYLYTFIVLVALVILILLYLRKKSKKLGSRKKAGKEIKNKVKNILGFFYMAIIFIVFISLIIYTFFTFAVIRDFFINYVFYILLGVIIVVIFIIIMKFNKKMREFFFRVGK